MESWPPLICLLTDGCTVRQNDNRSRSYRLRRSGRDNGDRRLSWWKRREFQAGEFAPKHADDESPGNDERAFNDGRANHHHGRACSPTEHRSSRDHHHCCADNHHRRKDGSDRVAKRGATRITYWGPGQLCLLLLLPAVTYRRQQEWQRWVQRRGSIGDIRTDANRRLLAEQIP